MGWADIITKDVMSNTAMRMYLRCPKSFEFRYVKGLKEPPDLKFAVGRGYHKTAEANYSQKLQTKKDLKVKTLKEIFAAKFKKIVLDDGLSMNKVVMGRETDSGVKLVETYSEQSAPFFQPLIEPESEFKITVPGARRPILGYIDLFANFTRRSLRIARFLADMKTTSRPYSQIQADTDIQLTIYTEGVKQLTGTPPDKVGFDTMVKAAKPYSQQLISTRTPAHVARFHDQYKHVEKAIDAGAFPPVDDHKICSWCGYRKICHKGRSWAV